MKKNFSNVMLVAVAAMAFFSCQKQEMTAPDASQEVKLTFASEKPAFDDETKTEWTGTTIHWSAGDRISVAYTVDGVWQTAAGNASNNAKLYKSEVLESAGETAKFNVSASFTGTGTGTHVFYGVYPAPSSTDFSAAPVANLAVSALQTPRANSFDGSADLMTGVSVGEFTSRPASTETISMKWTRLVAHANITLKALKDVTAGERVTSISLTAQEDANLVGQQKVNLLTNEVVKDNTAANVLELNGGNLTIDANGNIEFWACVLPETLTSLTVVVETDKATYTREITGISKTFKQNARNTLSVKMDAATRVEKAVESWVLVTPADGITEGTYVLVASTKENTGALVSSNGSSSAPTFEKSVSVEENILYGVTDAMQFDITGSAENWVLSVAGDASKWLYCTSANNGVRVGDNTNKLWTISTHTSNSDAFEFKHNSTSRYLGVYNNADWRCYTSATAQNFTNDTGSSQIYLYKKTSGAVAPDTTPKLEVSKTEIELSAAEAEGTVAVTCKNIELVEARALVAEGSQEESDWLAAEWTDEGVYYIASANESEESRTAVIEIYALDAEGNELVEYIAVTQKGKVDTSVITEVTVEEFLAKSVDANVWYKLSGTIKEIKNTTYGNFYLEDETGYVYVYGLTKEKAASNDQSFSSLNLKVGDVVTLIGTRAQYANASVADQKEQVGGPAYYVSHVAACAAPVITCADNTVTITAESGATIFYTTNGTVPTESSTKYTAAFPITEKTTVKAIAVATGKAKSAVAEKSCTYVDPNAEGGDAEPVTVTKTIKSISGTTTNGTQVLTMTLDDVITATASRGTNNGKVYSLGSEWRLYMSDSGTVTISAISGYTIKTVKFTYTVSNNGTLLNGTSQITSGTAYDVNAQSVTYSVGRTSGTKQGQVKVTEIEVVYQKN